MWSLGPTAHRVLPNRREEKIVAVKLRLMRMGKKKQPTYRVVAADSRSPRDGRFIEIIGFYNPRTEPSEIVVDNEKAVGWLRNGAKPTERVQKLLTISGAWAAFTGEEPPAPVVAEAKAEASAAEEVDADESIEDSAEQASAEATEQTAADEAGEEA